MKSVIEKITNPASRDLWQIHRNVFIGKLLQNPIFAVVRVNVQGSVDNKLLREIYL
jgi:hypothetical protein